MPSPVMPSPIVSSLNVSIPNTPRLDSSSLSEEARINSPSLNEETRINSPLANEEVILDSPSPNKETRLTFVDSDEPFDYSKTYTFTADEFEKFKSLNNKELIRAFDPAYLRKFSDTLNNEDFHKHLNSITNNKFQNSLANNVRKRIEIVLDLHQGNYVEANDNMNKTMNDPKGRI